MWSLILYVVCSMYVCVCMYVVFCKIDHCIHVHWCIVMGLGHNDPWVESHMWPQQTWGQRSSRDQWPLVQVFGKKVSVSSYFDVFSNLILQWLQKYLIAKAGETRGSRTALSHVSDWYCLYRQPYNLKLCRCTCRGIATFWQHVGSKNRGIFVLHHSFLRKTVYWIIIASSYTSQEKCN